MTIDQFDSARGIGRRSLVTIGALCLYCVGWQIPLAGISSEALGQLLSTPGTALPRLSVFMLGVLPIFSVLIVAEIAKLAFPALGRWTGLNRAIQIVALTLAAFQALGIANALEGINGLVDEPGWAFHAEMIATLVAATALLGWLGDCITRQGVGDGFWLLLIAPILTLLPHSGALVFEFARLGLISSSVIWVVLGYCLLASVLIVPLALTRWVPAGGLIGAANDEGRANGARFMDVWTPLLAQYVGALLIGGLWLAEGSPLNMASFAVGAPLHLLITAALIVGFAFLRAQSRGGMSRPAILAALAQIAVCCIGELLAGNLGLPFAIDGPWLIVVIATLTRVATTIAGRPTG
jgi:preprotein translocase subunit SecY